MAAHPWKNCVTFHLSKTQMRCSMLPLKQVVTGILAAGRTAASAAEIKICLQKQQVVS